MIILHILCILCTLVKSWCITTLFSVEPVRWWAHNRAAGQRRKSPRVEPQRPKHHSPRYTWKHKRVIWDQSLGWKIHIRAWYLQKTQLKCQLYGICIRFKFFQMSGKGLRGVSYSWWRCVIDNSRLLLRRHVFHFRKTYWWTTSFESTNGGGEGEWKKFRHFYNETIDHLATWLIWSEFALYFLSKQAKQFWSFFVELF